MNGGGYDDYIPKFKYTPEEIEQHELEKKLDVEKDMQKDVTLDLNPFECDDHNEDENSPTGNRNNTYYTIEENISPDNKDITLLKLNSIGSGWSGAGSVVEGLTTIKDPNDKTKLIYIPRELKLTFKEMGDDYLILSSDGKQYKISKEDYNKLKKYKRVTYVK